MPFDMWRHSFINTMTWPWSWSGGDTEDQHKGLERRDPRSPRPCSDKILGSYYLAPQEDDDDSDSSDDSNSMTTTAPLLPVHTQDSEKSITNCPAFMEPLPQPFSLKDQKGHSKSTQNKVWSVTPLSTPSSSETDGADDKNSNVVIAPPPAPTNAARPRPHTCKNCQRAFSQKINWEQHHWCMSSLAEVERRAAQVARELADEAKVERRKEKERKRAEKQTRSFFRMAQNTG